MPNSKHLTDAQKARFFDVISESVDIGFSIMDEELKYLFISDQVYTHLNIDREDLQIGGSLSECYEMMQAKGLFREQGAIPKMAEKAKNMSEDASIEQSTTILKLANGKTQELTRKKHRSGLTVSTSHDVSELIEKDQLFEEALTLGQAGYWIYNLGTKETRLSDSIHTCFDRATIDIIKKHGVFAGVHPDHKAQFHAAIKNAPNTGDRFEVTCRSIMVSEVEQWNQTIGQIVRDQTGKPIEIRAFIKDITQSHQQSTALQTARDSAVLASKAKSEFLANMSHEIRTPMNGVLGMAELLEQSDIDDRQRDYVKVITRSSEALLTIINDILDFSKIEAGAFELDPVSFNLRDAIDDVMSLLAVKAQEKSLELIVNYGPDLPRGFIGDVGRIRQIITNLIGNAIKFTDAGHVVLTVDAALEAEGHSKLTVSVADTGIGIEKEKLQAIFEKFTQADGSTTRVYGGTGLGLTISRKIINLMNGEISVESSLTEGSTFTFDITLPLDDTVISELPAEKDLTGRKALIIDDIDINRTILTERLQSWGMKTYAVDDSVKALNTLTEAQNAGDPYEIILLDFLMPNINGMELAKLIADNSKLNNVPTIMLSSCNQDHMTAKLREINICSYMVKPVREQQLLNAICRTIKPRNTALSATLAPCIQPKVSLPVPPAQRAQDTFNEIEAVLGSVALRPQTPVLAQASTNQIFAPDNEQYDILVAEDFPLNQEVVDFMLESSRYTPEFANNGAKAVELFKANPGKYSAVLMDISMPVMDGYEASELIKTMNRIWGESNIPIIALTGHALKHDREKCLDSNMDDYLTKPVKQDELISTLDNWVLNSQQENQSVAV